MEHVEELGKVERNVEDGVSDNDECETRHGARERSTILFKGHVICFTLSLRLSLEPHARKTVRMRRCTVYMFLGTPSVQATSCLDGDHRSRGEQQEANMHAASRFHRMR